MDIMQLSQVLKEMIAERVEDASVSRVELARNDLPGWRRKEVLEKYLLDVSAAEVLLSVWKLVNSEEL